MVSPVAGKSNLPALASAQRYRSAPRRGILCTFGRKSVSSASMGTVESGMSSSCEIPVARRGLRHADSIMRHEPWPCADCGQICELTDGLRLGSAQTAFAKAEELDESFQMLAAGRDIEDVEVMPACQLAERLTASGGVVHDRVTKWGVRSVHQAMDAGFRVFELHEADTRECLLQRIGHDDRHHVVPVARPLQGLVAAVVEKVAQEEQEHAPARDAVKKLQPSPEIRAGPLGPEDKEVSDDAQGMSGSLARRHELLHAVGTEDEPNLVVIPCRTQS